ncbi:MAG: methylated-DNA--[protein]-cysteine S-methyltransferase [Actinobacteria bacterium]|nr:methylated-DNA--[protein]-cysteine S-methyltransferase [Actinomycetota bacterium]
MALTHRTVSTPLGDITAVADDAGLTQVILAGDDGSVLAEATEGGPIVDAAAQQLAEYFAGERMAFDVPLAPQGTEFQQTVWTALGDVPFGTTATYGEIARAIGQLTATRAVGAANGRNPIPIIIPCHRVIGASGELTGYSGGGGIETKRRLLDHESGTLSFAI